MTSPTRTTRTDPPLSPEALRLACAQQLDARERGHFHDRPWLREAFLQVPREHFVPDRVWSDVPGEDGRCPVLDRARQPGRWLKAVYRPLTALGTQAAAGTVRVEDGPTDAPFTSSISCPAVVVDMLHHLDPQPGERVLEIGTGTGYSAALLACRVGAGNVVTVEIDAEVAAVAESNLVGLGIAVQVVVGDGEKGWPEGAPWDRIISTAAVREIPGAWLEQLRPGGVLLTPLDTPFGCDGLARLVGDGRGGAQGTLVGGVSFMKVRGQRDQRSFGELGWPAWADYKVSAGPAGQRIRTAP